MERSRTSLLKTDSSDNFIFCENASEILSMSSGCIRIQMSLFQDIKDGIYSLCNENKLRSDYMIFSLNNINSIQNYPGLYASFSTEGIVFSVWTRYGRFSIVDRKTNVLANTSFIIDFCWDSSGNFLGNGSTMAIFVNGENNAAGNFPIYNEILSNINFFALDSKDIDFSNNCFLYDFICFSQLPPFCFEKVRELTNLFCSEDMIVICGKNGIDIFVENFKYGSSCNIKCSSEYLYQTCGVCDVSGNLFFTINYNDGFNSCLLIKYDPYTNNILKTVKNLNYPSRLDIIQKDYFDYPRSVYYDNSECDGLWVSSNNKLKKFNSNLEELFELDFFGSIDSIDSQIDGSCYVCDYNSNILYKIDKDGNILYSFIIQKPLFVKSSSYGFAYVYSENKEIFLFKNDSFVKYISCSELISMDCHKKNSNLITCDVNGIVSKYNSKLQLIESNVSNKSFSHVLIRRGYNQNLLYILDSLCGKVFINNFTNINNNLSIIDYDKKIIFNGSFNCSAKNNGTIPFEGSFNMKYSSGRSIVKSLDVYNYKVDRKQLNLNANKQNGKYFIDNGLSVNNNPLDIQGSIIEVSEILSDN